MTTDCDLLTTIRSDIWIITLGGGQEVGRAGGVCALVVKIQNWYAERVGLDDLTYERWTGQINSFSEEGCAAPGTVYIRYHR